MTYLVTGGTGYIGSYVVRDLIRAGKKVVCFQRSGITQVAQDIIGLENLSGVKIIQGNISNTIQIFGVIKDYGIDTIIHLGYSMPPVTEEQPLQALQINCLGMNSILEAARLFKLKRVIWTSSSQAFGRVGAIYKEPIGDDDAVYLPDTMYGATKVLNEFMAKLYYRKYEVDSIGFRLPRVFGIGRLHGATAAFTETLRKSALNIPVNIDGPQHMAAYLYIEDASSIIVKACDVPTTHNRVFNVVEGLYSNRQLAEIIQRVNPQAQVTLSEGQDNIVKGFITPQISTEGVRRELGWQPKFTLEDAIRQIFNYFRLKEGLPQL